LVTACSGAVGHDSAECAVHERRFQQPAENEMEPPISRIILGTALTIERDIDDYRAQMRNRREKQKENFPIRTR
jgi:hypothetical protein